MSYRQRRATMINDCGIDGWKTGFDSNGFARRGFGPVDHRADHPGGDATLPRVKSSGSGPEIRYVNPAIYTESVDDEEPENDREQDPDGCHNKGDALEGISRCDSDFASTLELPVVAGEGATSDRTVGEGHPGRSTYRCYSTSSPDAAPALVPSTARSAISAGSGGTARVERRCKIDGVISVERNEANVERNEALKQERCVLDGRQVVRISTTSLSSESSDRRTAPSGTCRGIAHSEWMRRKQEAAQRAREREERAARERQEEEERAAREKEERTRLERENFLKWVERKRQQELDRRAILENELELQKRLKEIEDNLVGAKVTYLRRWLHRKKEEQRTRRKEQETKQRKLDEERERRLEQSTRAYEKWRENSKNKPKPATQGLLPHQKAKPAYVNPIPWQSIVETDPDDTQQDALEKKENISQLKMERQKNDRGVPMIAIEKIH